MQNQTLYIAIDDSGILSKTEDVACYGGIIFLNTLERDKFITQYKKIVMLHQCQYCKRLNNCNHQCPELKHYNLKPKHLRHFLNYLKKYILISCTIDNSKVYKNILDSKKAKGRYLDYAIKMMIKEGIKGLIKEKKINPYADINLVISLDEMSYKSNGYYNLEESIFEELKHGINNIKNNVHFQNVIYGNLKIALYFRNSKKSYLIQGADLIAGTVRKNTIKNQKIKNNIEEELNYINYKIYLPKEKRP